MAKGCAGREGREGDSKGRLSGRRSLLFGSEGKNLSVNREDLRFKVI